MSEVIEGRSSPTSGKRTPDPTELAYQNKMEAVNKERDAQVVEHETNFLIQQDQMQAERKRRQKVNEDANLMFSNYQPTTATNEIQSMKNEIAELQRKIRFLESAK